VAEGFIEHPEMKVNAGCTEGLKPKFYVPPAAERK
jgi:hypothetical protein